MRLSIDLSNRAGSFSLHERRQGVWALVEAFSLDGENKHSELLLDSLQSFLNKNKVTPAELTELVSSLGPGSFTGLRIAVSSLKGFSMAWNLPVFLVNGSEARGRAYRKRKSEFQEPLRIVTKVASQSYAVAKLSKDLVFQEDEALSLKEIEAFPEFLLVDTAETEAALKGSKLFPITAEYLGEQLESCSSKIEAKTFEELVKASPHYYGSSRF